MNKDPKQVDKYHAVDLSQKKKKGKKKTHTHTHAVDFSQKQTNK